MKIWSEIKHTPEIFGISLAGVGTSLVLPEIKASVDVASGYSKAIDQSNYFITHAHMDHAAGIPYVISQKALNNHKRSTWWMPICMVQPMKNIMNEWSSLESHEYDFEFVGVKTGDVIELGKNWKMDVFDSVHRIPTCGYRLSKLRKNLKREYKNLPEGEIRKLTHEGVIVSENFWQSQFAYTGDTQIEVFDKNPELLDVKYLFVEVTYFDSGKSVEEARKWGHIHFDEILPLIDQFKGDYLVFVHPSRRHKPAEIQRICEDKLSVSQKQKVVLF
ncbi:MAG: MBL fold metallo-hydrolase [Bdellovibrionales bacterium CG10_big_fil_rev_8_21_14_0_10_45_34]|nr:MAG: MBL fold metallo-hydrolase [Bdellovibrionales bacterium CG10_big_fil_rev_8_21_14_0_10_45_34]